MSHVQGKQLIFIDRNYKKVHFEIQKLDGFTILSAPVLDDENDNYTFCT